MEQTHTWTNGGPRPSRHRCVDDSTREHSLRGCSIIINALIPPLSWKTRGPMKGGTLRPMPHHWGPSGRREPRPRPHTQATARKADQVRGVRPRPIDSPGASKQTHPGLTLWARPLAGARLRMTSAEGLREGPWPVPAWVNSPLCFPGKLSKNYLCPWKRLFGKGSPPHLGLAGAATSPGLPSAE